MCVYVNVDCSFKFQSTSFNFADHICNLLNMESFINKGSILKYIENKIYMFITFNLHIVFCIFVYRKRSFSESSNSSSDVSLGGSHYRRKKHARSKKMDEVERLAEMERQRRQKEAEQRV